MWLRLIGPTVGQTESQKAKAWATNTICWWNTLSIWIGLSVCLGKTYSIFMHASAHKAKHYLETFISVIIMCLSHSFPTVGKKTTLSHFSVNEECAVFDQMWLNLYVTLGCELWIPWFFTFILNQNISGCLCTHRVFNEGVINLQLLFCFWFFLVFLPK